MKQSGNNGAVNRTSRKILLVGNPTSRSGKTAAKIDKARILMNEVGLNHEFKSTLPYGETVELVRNAIELEGFDFVVCMGGDGTFNEVAKAIVTSSKRQDVILGMLPAGTANDQGKSFGISSAARAMKTNVRILARGTITALDVGKVTAFRDDGSQIRQDLFFDSIGFGLSAAILAFRNRERELVQKMPGWREIYRDQAVYVRATMHKMTIDSVTRERFTLELNVDGEVSTMHGVSDLVISNTPLYAGEWLIGHNGCHEDGKFEVAPFVGTRDWTSKLIIHHKRNPLTVELLNKIGLSHSPMLQGSKIQIQILRPTTDKRLPSQIDGDEFVQSDHFEVEVLQKHLNIVVPNNYHWI